MSDGKVTFDIRGDSSRLPYDLDQATSTIAKKTAGWTALANTAVSSITNVAAKAAKGTADLIKNGVEYNALIQDYTTSFTTMLGSTDAAQQKVEALKQYATKTPFAFTDLADATNTMLSFGVSNEEASVALQHLGDISQGNAQKLSSLALVYGQVRSSGKLMGQDLLQMINAGFNPLQTIAQKTGASMADLKAVMSGEKTSGDFTDLLAAARKEVDELGAAASEGALLLTQIGEDGEISADTVAAAMRIATSEGGLFFNAMATQSQTFNGQLSTLQDNLAALGGSLTKSLFDSLAADVMPTVNGWVERLQAAFDESGLKGMGAEIGEIIGEVVMDIDWPTPEDVLGKATEWWNTAGGIVAGVCSWTLQLFGMPPATAETVGAEVEKWWTTAGSFGISPWTEADSLALHNWWTGVYENIRTTVNWVLNKPFLPDANTVIASIEAWWNGIRSQIALTLGFTIHGQGVSIHEDSNGRNSGGSVGPHFASGAILTGTKRLLSRDGSFSTVGEAGAEAILPLDMLWQRLGMMLDTTFQEHMAMLPITASPGVPAAFLTGAEHSLDDLPDRIAKAVREAVSDLHVDMDGQTVAQIITPHVSEEIAADASMRRWTT